MSGMPPTTPLLRLTDVELLDWIRGASPDTLQRIDDLLSDSSQSEDISALWQALAADDKVDFGMYCIGNFSWLQQN